MNNNKNRFKSIVIGIIITVLVIGSIYAFFSTADKKTKNNYIMVGMNSSGVTFTNDKVDIYIIDFKKLEENVDYKITEGYEVYYFVNTNSRVYILATKNEVDVYVYKGMMFVNYYDLKNVEIRYSKKKVDLRP